MDAMDMSDMLTLVLVLLGVLALLGVAVIGFVMWRYRIPPRGLIAMIGALANPFCFRSFTPHWKQVSTLMDEFRRPSSSRSRDRRRTQISARMRVGL